MELHWNRGLCITNEGNGFVDPDTFKSPCHDLFSSDEFIPDAGYSWYFYKLKNSKLSSSIITWTCYTVHLFLNICIVYVVQRKKQEIDKASTISATPTAETPTINSIRLHQTEPIDTTTKPKPESNNAAKNDGHRTQKYSKHEVKIM